MAWFCSTLGGAVDMRAQGGGRRYAQVRARGGGRRYGQLHGVVGADEVECA